MDNPKIIKISPKTKISTEGGSYVVTKTQNCTVIAETETHFFFKLKRTDVAAYSVKKSDIKHVTYKNRTLDFKDLKKADILNVFENYEKLIRLAQQISRQISQLRVDENDMSTMDPNEVDVFISKEHILLKRCYIDKTYKCKVPLKYLWDHNWRKNLIEDYGEIQ